MKGWSILLVWFYEDTLHVFIVVEFSMDFDYHKVDNCFCLIPDNDLKSDFWSLKTNADGRGLCIK